jgi:predicted alpha/beta-fold hydrolase
MYGRAGIESNPCLRLIATEYGGHLGFLSRHGPRFWVDDVAIGFFRSVIAGAVPDATTAGKSFAR